MQPVTLVQNWKIDTNHTGINFKVKHLGLATIRGSFGEFEGEVVKSESDSFENASISLTIQTASITTGNDMRDNHLRTSDFLDVFTFPEISFVSNAFTKVSDNLYNLTGELTIKGITREVTLQADFSGTITDMWGNTVSVFLVNGSINRLDFGVTWNEHLDGGIPVIGKDIHFEINVELLPNE
jgi:polyisoprenoid-binding protein YceI